MSFVQFISHSRYHVFDHGLIHLCRYDGFLNPMIYYFLVIKSEKLVNIFGLLIRFQLFQVRRGPN